MIVPITEKDYVLLLAWVAIIRTCSRPCMSERSTGHHFKLQTLELPLSSRQNLNQHDTDDTTHNITLNIEKSTTTIESSSHPH
jgi:hypothetical protein